MLGRICGHYVLPFREEHIFITVREKLVSEIKTTSKKNILIIIQHLYRGGAENDVCKLSVELCKWYNVTIATFYSDQLYPNTYPHEGKLVSHNELEEKNFLNKILSRLKFIRKIKKDNNIDVAISFLKGADLINALTTNSKHKTIQYVVTDVNMLIKTATNKLIYSYIFSKIDKVLVQNELNYKSLKNKVDNRKLSIIPNLLNLADIQDKSKERIVFKNDHNDCVFAITGTLYSVKGQKHIFKILAHLKKIYNKQFKLILQGGLNEIEDYEIYADSLQLKMFKVEEANNIDLNLADIFVIGFSQNPYKLMRSVDANILSSYYEGLPNALIESMSCGAPVIAADCQTGPKELLGYDDENKNNVRGFLLPKFHVDSLSQKALSPAEMAWKDFFLNVLNEKINLESHVHSAREYAEQFDSKLVSAKWKEIIDDL
jgi:glycosyltransferase involved in cell wall biosynthesis